MSDQSRPPIRIRFSFNIETGEMEFIIDDASPDLSEEYHDKVAHAIASYLSHNPDIRNAGPIRIRRTHEQQAFSDTDSLREKKDERGKEVE